MKVARLPQRSVDALPFADGALKAEPRAAGGECRWGCALGKPAYG
jgi:hypothetical protein